MYELIIKSEFSAAHHLRNYKGKCEQVHGHNYLVDLFISAQTIGKSGLLMDFTHIKAVLRKVLDEFDHKDLNKVKDFRKLNPTAENIAFVIHSKLKNKMPKDVQLKVCIWESLKTGAVYSDVM